MPLRPVYGHEALRARLGTAVTTGRLPQVMLLVGPPGSGKQRLALWLGQALLCPDATDGPCGRCHECTLARDLAHPDLHWFVPIPRGKATDPAKQTEEAKFALADVMAERRETGRWEPADGTAGHWLASVRLLQRVVQLTPFRGKSKVVILGDAERMIVQQASLEAANALLKVLEEPPADTVIILTAAEPLALLPTIRSRVVPVRVGRVSDAAVREFLTREVDASGGPALDRRVLAADGMIGRALAAATDDKATQRARDFLDAVSAGSDRWSVAALSQPPWGARAGFAELMAAVAVELREHIRQAAADTDHPLLARRLAALELVQAAQEGIGTNVNPQLALAELAGALERVA
jgi:DNA polymerase-3 subunit delta'